MNFFRGVAHIDLEAVQNNILCVKKLTPRSKVLAMVKSNAYGHNAVEISKVLESHVNVLGVSCLQEALELHSHHIQSRIVIWGGFLDDLELQTIADLGFETIIHNFEQLHLLEAVSLSKPLTAWLKIDTGMNRLGFKPHQFQEANRRLLENRWVTKPLHYMTHFSDADKKPSEKTIQQMAHFETITADWSGFKGLANSAAILNWPKTHQEWIRPGIVLYGITATDHVSIEKLGFKPVMTLTSRIIAIKEIKKGEPVGYAGSWISPKKSRVGVVAIGYGDGYPWHMKKGTVLVKGVACPIVGRVCMDYITIDLTKLPAAQVGDQVILWGRGLPIETVAEKAGTSPYEPCCQLTRRVKFNYYEKSSELEKVLNH